LKNNTFQEKVVKWEKHLLSQVKKGVGLEAAAFEAQQSPGLEPEDIEALAQAVDNIAATLQELLRPIY
jgi:hypothetical protein